MKKNLQRFVAFALLSVVPFFASAASAPSSIKDFLENLTGIFRNIIPLLVLVAILAFFWGLAKLILNAGNEDLRQEGKSVMIWGIIALFVMSAMWGIVILLSQTIFGTGAPTL